MNQSSRAQSFANSSFSNDAASSFRFDAVRRGEILHRAMLFFGGKPCRMYLPDMVAQGNVNGTKRKNQMVARGVSTRMWNVLIDCLPVLLSILKNKEI